MNVNFPSNEILNIYSTGFVSGTLCKEGPAPLSAHDVNPEDEELLWFIEVRIWPTATKQLRKFEESSKSSSLEMFIFEVGHDFR